ncbi:MAG: hypothetical protein RIC95_11875 [Vicingaceae bacterium]
MKSNHEEQLKLIEEMIESTKVKISEGSIFYLIWGWLVILAAALNYYLLVFAQYENHWIVWPILMPIGGIVSMIIGRKQAKKAKRKTFIDRALNYLWGGFVITLLLALLGIVRLGPEGVYPIIMLLYGLGTFVSGGILKFRPLIIGAMGAWLVGIVAFFVPFQEQLILLGVSILVSYLIPGYLLSKSSQHV